MVRRAPRATTTPSTRVIRGARGRGPREAQVSEVGCDAHTRNIPCLSTTTSPTHCFAMGPFLSPASRRRGPSANNVGGHRDTHDARRGFGNYTPCVYGPAGSLGGLKPWPVSPASTLPCSSASSRSAAARSRGTPTPTARPRTSSMAASACSRRRTRRASSRSSGRRPRPIRRCRPACSRSIPTATTRCRIRCGRCSTPRWCRGRRSARRWW